MSFKRDGNDKCALENLRKRRVSDLLFEDIQDEEVSKLRNGRYLCKVCLHCPTFDTINMFQVHKQGKKHQHSVEYKEMKNLELVELKQKREHEQAISGNSGSVSQVLGPAASSVYHKPTPYDPRSKRHKVKIFDRKTVVDLHNHAETSTNYNTSATSLNSMPGNRTETTKTDQSFKQEIGSKVPVKVSPKYSCTDGQSSRSSHNTHLKSWDNTVSRESRKIGNNTSKHKLHVTEADDELVKPSTVSKLIDAGNTEKCTQHYFARKQKFHFIKNPDEHSAVPNQRQDFSKSWEYFKDKPTTRFVVANRASKEVKNNTCEDSRQNDKTEETESQHNTCVHEKNSCSKSIPEKKERAEKMLKAFGSGWKKDWTGKWIKDEDVEFDSDEEPPDIA